MGLIIKQNTHFRLRAYIVSLELDAPSGRTRSKYVPTRRFSSLAVAISLSIVPTNQLNSDRSLSQTGGGELKLLCLHLPVEEMQPVII